MMICKFNLQMSRHDHIKVADLGLAKLQGRILGTVCGTPLYMAPEVHDGKPYCTKADMYSFGLMMWEMWFGKRVFSELRCQRGELLRRIKEENYRPQTPRSDGRFTPNLPPAQWTEVMTSCWQTESSLRKTTAESKDFVKEIKHSLAGIWFQQIQLFLNYWDEDCERFNTNEMRLTTTVGVTLLTLY